LDGNMRPLIDMLLSLLATHADDDVPKIVVEQELTKAFPCELCKAAIQEAVAAHLVSLVVEYPMEQWGIPDDYPVWHLRIPSADDEEAARKMLPVEAALVEILQGQGDLGQVGELKEQDARAALASRGFDERDLRILWIDGVADNFWTTTSEGQVEWVRLVPEYDKTEEHWRSTEDYDAKAIEMSAIHMHMIEEEQRELGRRRLREQKRMKDNRC